MAGTGSLATHDHARQGDLVPTGQVLSATGSMAQINPLRYRGYYHDTDTGLYYLQSWYYDPEIGRFINADDPGLIASLSQSIALGANIFVYCENNPVMYSDPSGNYVVSAITIPEFYNITWSITKELKRKIYGSRPSFAIWTVRNNSQFVNAWNAIGNTDYLIILVHGAQTLLTDKKSFNFDTDDIRKLRYKKVKCVILLSCYTGDAEFMWINAASQLKARVSGTVIAPNGDLKIQGGGVKNRYGDVLYKFYPVPTPRGLKAYRANWVAYKVKNKGLYSYGYHHYKPRFITISELIDIAKRLRWI